VTIAASDHDNLKAIENVKVSFSIFPMSPMITVLLINRDQYLFFHLPSLKVYCSRLSDIDYGIMF